SRDYCCRACVPRCSTRPPAGEPWRRQRYHNRRCYKRQKNPPHHVLPSPVRPVHLIRTPSSPDVLDASQHAYFPSTATLQAFATRNFTTRLAGILRGSPVCGLRPIRAFRLTKTSLPRPGKVKVFLASLQARAARCSSSSPAAFLVTPIFSARYPVTCDFVIAFPIALPPDGVWAVDSSAVPETLKKRNRLSLLSAVKGPIAPSTCRSVTCPLRM